ncbi:SDR family NAD(P)-dependent oxidoreductase [Streptomyces sp. NPDC059355]|uniref:SDR family NAD(P)-dependent oxidoreductase n=1 Tax=Streptomyces sp. NPDC059355 TaxID=3346811 RepID=UPI0036950C0E
MAADLDELAARLERARGFTAGDGVHVREESADPGQVAFLFPGQGSQRVGMLGDLYAAFPGLRVLLDDAPRAVVTAVFPPGAFTVQARAAQRAAVTDTRIAQPALGLAGAAAHLLLGRLGVRPDCVAGHSYGELTALWAAGVYGTASLLRLSTRRAEAILTAAGEDPGSMAAVLAAPEEVRELAERAGCVVPNHNAPRQCAVSGPTAAVAVAVGSLHAAGISAQPLPVACAFHSPVVAEAAAGLAAELAGTAVADAAVPVWSNTTAAPYPQDAEAVRGLLARQVAEPVRFVDQVEAMYAAGVRTFVEAGPGRVLSGLVGRILADRPHTAVPLDVPGEHGLTRLVTALAELAAAGVPVTPEPLFRGRTAALPDRAPRRPGWLVDGHLTRTAAGTPIPGGLRPAIRVGAPARAPEPAPAPAMAWHAAPATSEPVPVPGAGQTPHPAHAAAAPPAPAARHTEPAASTAAHAQRAGKQAPAVAWPAEPAAPLASGPAPGPVGTPAPYAATGSAGSASPAAYTASATAVPGAVWHAAPTAPDAAPAPGYAVPAVPGPDRRQEAVLEYLRGSRELIEAQRAVLLGYLGATAAPAGVPAGVDDTAAPTAAQAWPGTGEVATNGQGPAGGPGWPDAWEAGANGNGPAGLTGLGPPPAPTGAPAWPGTTGAGANGNGPGGIAGPAGWAAPTGAPVRPGAGEAGVNGHGPGGGAGAGAGAEGGLDGAESAGDADDPAPAGDRGSRAQVGAGSAEEVMDAVLEIVHTRTGYPRDMLDPELDLEADLSIDSIKRVEIIGALADRIGLPTDPGGSAESAVEELSRIKTLRGIVDWVTTHAPGSDPAPAAEGAAAGPASAAASTPPTAQVAAGPAPGPAAAPAPVGPAPGSASPPAGSAPAATLRRMRVDEVPIAAADGDPGALRGLRVGVVEDGRGVAAALCGALEAQGVRGEVLARAEAGFDGIVDLSALRAGQEPVLPAAFPGYRRALTGGVRRLILGSTPGSGLHGFARSAALEFPGTLVRAVDLHPKEDPGRIAAQLLAELSDPGEGLASVGYTAEGLRIARRPVPAPLPPAAGSPLGPGSVVLLSGGARGITARTAVALARVTGCHVELMGRTPEPSGQGDEFVHAGDRVALRAALIRGGLRTPAEIEAAASRILAEREVRATLAALAGTAASVRYHRADVADADAVRAVVADVRARHGRLDGIVHGAGTLRDGLLRDKEPDVFTEVFTTKVAGARNLAAAAAEHGAAPAPAFLALFGSVAGVYGNRGQSDYAAANDALDGLAHTWADTFPGRVLSVDWGPWAAEAGGMVTPELERAYARRGIPLISPEAGTTAFLAELAHGGDVQVVLMAQEGAGHE